MSRHSPSYQDWATRTMEQLKADRVTQGDIAKKADVHQPYVTLVLRGVIPGRDVAARIGEALCGDAEEGLIRAGFLPDRYRHTVLQIHNLMKGKE